MPAGVVQEASQSASGKGFIGFEESAEELFVNFSLKRVRDLERPFCNRKNMDFRTNKISFKFRPIDLPAV